MSRRHVPKLQLEDGRNSGRSKTIGRGRPNIDTTPPPLPPNRRQTWHRTSAPPQQESILSPNIAWEPGMFTIDYILRNLPFPRVVLCDHSSCNRNSALGFDCSQLMLLYSNQNGVKISARSLALNSSDGNTLIDTNDRLVIPEDYKGWFAVIGSGSTLPPIPFYKHVGQLSMSDCHTFLIGGSKNVVTVQKATDETIIKSRELYPGDVLRMGTLDETQKRLYCTDENDRDIYLPVETQGTFYVIKNKTRVNKVPVMQIKEIMSTRRFPCRVKLIHGREPTDAGVFTKLMTLEEVIQDTSILASTTTKPRNTLHELMTDVPNKFKVAVPNKELLQSSAYLNAMHLCVDKGDLFMRNIKLTRFTQLHSPVKGRTSVTGFNFTSPVRKLKDVRKSKSDYEEPVLNPYTPFPSLKTGDSVSQNGIPTADEKPDASFPDTDVTVNGDSTGGESEKVSLTGVEADTNDENDIIHAVESVMEYNENFDTSINVSGSKRKPRPNAYEQIWSKDTVVLQTQPVQNESSVKTVVTVQNSADLPDSVEVQELLRDDAPETNSFSTDVSQIQDDYSENDLRAEASSKAGQFMSKIVVDKPLPRRDEVPTNEIRDPLCPEEPDESLDDGREDDVPSSPSDATRQRQKKVSFSDILNVRSFPQQHVTTIKHVPKSHEQRIHYDAQQHIDTNGNNDDDGYSKLSDNLPDGTGAPGDLPRFVPERFSLTDPSSGEDEKGYLIPKLTRKGRVKLEKDSDKKSKDNDVARTLTLPKLTVADSGKANARLEKRRSSETENDVLW